MLVCVDGTGPTDRAEYMHLFEHSFVNRIKHAYSLANPPPELAPIYHRGPGADFSDGIVGSFGGASQVSPGFVVEEIVDMHRRLSEEAEAIPSAREGVPVSTWSPEETEEFRLIQERRKLFLVGHSRGGAIVIHAARILNRRGIAVEALFLFDAVARNLGLDADEIPANVRNCYHAMRLAESGSRPSFGNCGTTAATGVYFKRQRFMTTHGGMGGTPLGSAIVSVDGMVIEPPPAFMHGALTPDVTHVSPAQETAGMEAVEQWMWPYLRSHGVVP